MVPDSRLDRAQSLTAEIRRLQLELEGLGLTQAELAASGSLPVVPATTAPSKPAPKRRLQPVRDQVLMILAEVGLPMLSRDIQAYAQAKYGISIDATRFGSLRRTEMEAYDRGSQRSTWIAYGLTDRGEAIKRLLTRSDLPLIDRVVGPLSGRRLFFETTARLCEILSNEEGRIEDLRAFQILVADHARDLPGIGNFQKATFPITEWLALAKSALEGVKQRDLADRHHIARRLTMLGDKDKLFGTEFMAEDHTIDPPIEREKLAR